MFLKRDTVQLILGALIGIVSTILLANYTPLVVLLKTYLSYKWLLIIFLLLLAVLCLVVPYIFYLRKKISKLEKRHPWGAA